MTFSREIKKSFELWILPEGENSARSLVCSGNYPVFGKNWNDLRRADKITIRSTVLESRVSFEPLYFFKTVKF